VNLAALSREYTQLKHMGDVSLLTNQQESFVDLTSNALPLLQKMDRKDKPVEYSDVIALIQQLRQPGIHMNTSLSHQKLLKQYPGFH